MPIMICARCGKPAPDSFHEFEEVCECRDWFGEAKKKGWELKRPKKGGLKLKDIHSPLDINKLREVKKNGKYR